MGEIIPLRLCLVRPIYNDKCQVTDVALSQSETDMYRVVNQKD